jgi:site-specific DNA-methyltransferase (cytosine-N4-specific)
MDQKTFKAKEIGSHRKYSKKINGATAQTFEAELREILTWLRGYLETRRYAIFVIGDSIIQGQVVKNNEMLAQVAEQTGYIVAADIERTINSGRKAFNPAVGKIKDEHIVVIRKVE